MFAAHLARRSGQLLQVWGNSIQNASVDTSNEIKVVVIETYTFKQAGYRGSHPLAGSGSSGDDLEMNTSDFALPNRTFGPDCI
ncbi:hypothetical protein [Roseovarius indicus]|uniref:hypothetical protein n=1 Tax=Roseovarius indicus TaxID=540747 RepID=UPI0032ECB2B3